MEDKDESFIEKIFGTYKPPKWIKKAGEGLTNFFTKTKKYIQKHKKIFIIIPCIVLLSFLLLTFFYIIVQNKEEFKNRNIFTNSLIKTEKVYVESWTSNPYPNINLNKKPEPWNVYFDGSVCELANVGKEVKVAIKISPDLLGTWTWISDTTLSFQPDTDWQVGTKYTIDFPKKGLFAEHITTNYKLKIIANEFSAYIENAEYAIDSSDKQKKQAVFTINANYPVDIDKLKKLISIRPKKEIKSGYLSDKKYNFTISQDKETNKIYIVTQILPTPQNSSKIILRVKNGMKSIFGGNSIRGFESELIIPGVSDYIKVKQVNVTLVKREDLNYDQALVIETQGSVEIQELEKNLSVYLLPIYKPSELGTKGSKEILQEYSSTFENDKNYQFNWNTYSSNEITDTIIANSEKVKVNAILGENNFMDINSFSINVPSDRFIYVKIAAGTKFYGDYELVKESNSIIEVPSYPKEISIMSEGTILSYSGSRRISIFSRGVDNVKYLISKIKMSEINNLVSMSNGNLRNFEFKNNFFNEENIAETMIKEYAVADASKDELSYFSYQFNPDEEGFTENGQRTGLYLFNVTDAETNISYDKRLIHITDLGIIVKTNSDQRCDVFIQSNSNGQPIENAIVSLIGKNGSTLISSKTTSDGHVVFDASLISSFTKTGGQYKPIAYVVTKNSDISFMPFYAKGSILDYSDFETGGIYETSVPDKIFAYVFSDRGIYRPGETVNIGMIIKAGDWSKNISRTPIEIAVTDPNGNEIVTQRSQISYEGLQEFNFVTETYSPTGEYTITIYLVKSKPNGKEYRTAIQFETVKIEEFLPDSLELKTSFEPNCVNGWVTSTSVKGKVSLRNLFGTPAVGNKISSKIQLTPGLQQFEEFKDYCFTDPMVKENSYSTQLDEVQTDKDGIAIIDINLENFEKATYCLDLTVEAFEKGNGRGVSSVTSLFISPLNYLIGYKADSDLTYIKKLQKCKMNFISINSQLEQIDLSDVTMKIEEKKYISALVKQPSGLYKYQSIQKTFPVSEKKITIPKNGLEYYLPTDKEGEFELTLINSDGLVFNKISFSIIGETNISRSLTRTAELDIRLEKSDLQKGEEATLFIKAPYEGSGLITIERDGVYTWKWFTTNTKSSTQTISIPSELEGNGYINVLFSRSQSSKEIYTSPFCYGTVPFSISKENRNNPIKINVPKKIEPGKDYTINYSTKYSGKIIVYLVDEGILQVAKYITPNPLSYFFQKKALEVITSQTMDLVLPDYKTLQSLSATGGGAEMNELSRNINPFKRKQNKPVVYWSGILESSPVEKSITYKIPEYFNGKIKVIAVAATKEHIGVATNSTIVQAPIILTPNIPMFTTPGDEFEVVVTVSNNLQTSNEKLNLTLEAIPSKQLSIIGETVKQLSIDTNSDVVTTYKIKTNDLLGDATILFNAKSQKGNASNTAYLSVRPGMPYQVLLSSGYLKKEKIFIDVNQKFYDEFATRNVSVSYLPISLTKGLIHFLQEYPYGCTEQIVSSTYPLLYPSLIDNLELTQDEITKYVQRTISIIQARMNASNYVGLWTHKSNNNSILTIYCTQFLTEARNAGYYVPENLYDTLLNTLSQISCELNTSNSTLSSNGVNNINRTISNLRHDTSNNDVTSNQNNTYVRSYAAYVLMLNDILQTTTIEQIQNDMNNEKEVDEYTKIYLAACNSIMKKQKEGELLIKSVNRKFNKQETYFFNDSLHFTSIYLDVVCKYFPKMLNSISSECLLEIADDISNNYYSTFSATEAIRAINSYRKVAPVFETASFNIEKVTTKKSEPIELTNDYIMEGTFTNDTEKVSIENKDSQYLFYQITQSGFSKTIPIKEFKNKIEVNREYVKIDGSAVKQIKLGDELLVNINFRTLNNIGSVENIAIVDMIPAGFEIDIDSIRNQKGEIWKPDYVDIREDRIILFGTVNPNVDSYSYKVRAINKGVFLVPPLFAEAMYDKMIKALQPHDKITIVENEK